MKRLLPLALVALAACGPPPSHPSSRFLFTPQAPVAIDIATLEGTWFEIARFPDRFSAGCRRTQATYTPQADGTVAVLNQCTRGGQVVQIAGVATVAGPGELRVNLDGVPFAGNLIVLAVLDQGRTLVLGSRWRTAGFVLHRDQRLTPGQLNAAREVFRRNGYDVAALQRTPQR
jgi:apolipoprotein D and lipocalin family protein